MHKLYRKRKIGNYEANSDGTETEVGTGSFYKKGKFGINNWKLRQFKVLSTRKLIYIDPETDKTKGVLDLSGVTFSAGSPDSVFKCLSAMKGRSKSDANSRATMNTEVSEAWSDEKCLYALTLNVHQSSEERLQHHDKLHLVFEDADCAKDFCMWVTLVTTSDNFEEFVKGQGWEEHFAELHQLADCTEHPVGGLSDEREDAELSLEPPQPSVAAVSTTSQQSTYAFASTIYKQSKVRKVWKERFLYVTHSGLLVYKESVEDKKIAAKFQLEDCDWFRFRSVMSAQLGDVVFSKKDVADGGAKSAKEQDKKAMISVECIELIDVKHDKNLVITFNFLDLDKNLEQVKEFEAFLTSATIGRITDLSSASDNTTPGPTSDGTVRASLNDTDEPQDGHTDPAPSNDDDNRDKDNQQGAEDVTEGDEEFESTTFSSQSGAAFVAQNAKVLVFVVCFFVAVANHVAKHPGRKRILLLPVLLLVIVVATRIHPQNTKKDEKEGREGKEEVGADGKLKKL